MIRADLGALSARNTVGIDEVLRRVPEAFRQNLANSLRDDIDLGLVYPGVLDPAMTHSVLARLEAMGIRPAPPT